MQALEESIIIENCVQYCQTHKILFIFIHKILISKYNKTSIHYSACNKVTFPRRNEKKNHMFCLKCADCMKETSVTFNT